MHKHDGFVRQTRVEEGEASTPTAEAPLEVPEGADRMDGFVADAVETHVSPRVQGTTGIVRRGVYSQDLRVEHQMQMLANSRRDRLRSTTPAVRLKLVVDMSRSSPWSKTRDELLAYCRPRGLSPSLR